MASWALLMTGIGIVFIVGLLTVWGVPYLERRRRCAEPASALQPCLAEPISRGPRLASAAVLPAVMLHGGGETTVVITGQVASEQARQRVLDVARRVAPAATLVDHLEVLPRDHGQAG